MFKWSFSLTDSVYVCDDQRGENLFVDGNFNKLRAAFVIDGKW
jgi:hypothetical protein